MNRKRYALVGTGSRAAMYISAIAHDLKDTAELVAVCVTTPGRMDY